MKHVSQPLTDPQFVQNPYGFYDAARAHGPVVFWTEYGLTALMGYAEVTAALRDRRMGRVPPDGLPGFSPDMSDFARAEAFSLLNLEGDRHARLRSHVLRAFTSRRVAALAPEIKALCESLIDAFPKETSFDLVAAYAARVPVIVIARLLGVPETACAQLLSWSHAMVAMYRPSVSAEDARAANDASREFSDWLGRVMDTKRSNGKDDLLSALLDAETQGALTRDECLATVILLLNAGHEATVHSLGNAVVRLLSEGHADSLTAPQQIAATVEECLRIDPPLHVFARYVLEPLEIGGHAFEPGDEVLCMLGAANRDPSAFDAPDRFRPGRTGPTLTSFGAGVQFCLGAPLARLELQIALQVLFERCPDLNLSMPAELADIYHFHGHARLMVTCGS